MNNEIQQQNCTEMCLNLEKGQMTVVTHSDKRQLQRDQLVSAIKIQYNGLNGEIIYLLFINMAICMLVALYR